MTTEEMLDEIAEVLEPNAAYYSYGRDEWARYFPQPEVLDALGFLITTVVLPILTNIISDDLKERLKQWRHTRKEVRSSDIQTAIEQAARGPNPQKKDRAAAIDAVSSILRDHGWPAAKADMDAESIVRRVSHSLWGDEE